MGAPDLIPGGVELNQGSIEGPIQPSVTYGNSTGVFSKNPGSTPKYAINKGIRDNEFRETMARLFIQIPESERDLFVKSVPEESRELAEILCGVGEGASGGTGFIDFILNTAVEDFQEKYQLIETMSDNFIIYMFGQRAVPFQYSGILYNSYQDDQRVWMLRLYRDILRGTQLARRKTLVRLRYDSVIVTGVFLGMQQTLSGDAENYVNFSFVIQPTQYVIFSPPYGSPTKLSTPFIESGALALNTVDIPNTRQLKIVAPSRAQIPDATVKRKNEQAENPYGSIEDKTKALRAQEALDSRTKIINADYLYGDEYNYNQSVDPEWFSNVRSSTPQSSEFAFTETTGFGQTSNT